MLKPTDSALTDTDEHDIAEIDMDLDDDKPQVDDDQFGSGNGTIPNIWSIDESESDEDSSDESDHETSDKDSEEDKNIVSSSIEEDLEKPSFLRRLSKKKKSSKNDDQ